MRLSLLVLTLTLLIAGCVSFTRTEINVPSTTTNTNTEYITKDNSTPDIPKVVPKPDKTALSTESVIITTKYNTAPSIKLHDCNVAKKIILPKIPPLPLKELNVLVPDDTETLSIIEKKYIFELREYISNVKSVINKYSSQC